MSKTNQGDSSCRTLNMLIQTMFLLHFLIRSRRSQESLMAQNSRDVNKKYSSIWPLCIWTSFCKKINWNLKLIGTLSLQ